MKMDNFLWISVLDRGHKGPVLRPRCIEPGEGPYPNYYSILFCARHDLVIGGTIFLHKDCHKVTWVSPDHKTENQIDHVAIGQWRRSLLDVRNKRGADIGSDHHLVVANFELKIQAHKQRTKQLRKR
jgi:hypothetical protein